MSYSKFTKPVYSSSALEKQYVNSIFTSHDLICGCNDPADHTIYLLKKTQPKCPGTTDTTQNAGEELDIDVGDLETLFAEDTDAGGAG